MNEYFGVNFFIIIIVFKNYSAITFIFHEDLVFFNSSLISIKCIFIFLKYSVEIALKEQRNYKRKLFLCPPRK